MPSTLFLRLTGEPDKAAALEYCLNDQDHPLRFEANAKSFEVVPGSPFCYWVSDYVRSKFGTCAPFQEMPRTAASGASSNNDPRFIRSFWEVSSGSKKWVFFAKGGAFSPYFSSIHLVLNWFNDGYEIKEYVTQNRASKGWSPHWKAELHNPDLYYRPGLTWPRRTTSGLGFRALPTGCIFADKGPAAFVEENAPEQLLALLALTNSAAFKGFVALQLAAADAAARSYEVGVIQRTPVPPVSQSAQTFLSHRANSIWALKQQRDQIDESSLVFLLPALLMASGSTLAARSTNWYESVQLFDKQIDDIQTEIDDKGWELYGIEHTDRLSLAKPAVVAEGLESEDEDDESEDEGIASVTSETLAEDLASWVFGAAIGRWDADIATGKRPIPILPGPFDALPAVSRGMLLGADGFHPARDRSGRFIPEHDLLVDDEGHGLDLVQQALNVLAQVAGAQAEAWQQELEGLLGSDLRTWYRRTYFERHLKRHSKSRRKAPVYWQLGTSSGSYSVWLYYPRLTQDSLYRVLNETVKPKVQQEEQRLTQLRQAQARASEVEAQETFVEELRSFQEEVARVAPLFAPNLDDGVLLNAAPLWRLTPHNGWRKDTKAAWEALAKGDYDWAHLALKLWPERVIPKCAKERHLALAHDLEGALKTHSVADLIAQHTRPAVQEALAQLQAAPALGGASRAPRATRAPRASQAAPAPEADSEAEPAILRVLADFPGGAAKAEVLARIRLSDGQWNGTIAQLLAQGWVRREGEKRGTKYFLNP